MSASPPGPSPVGEGSDALGIQIAPLSHGRGVGGEAPALITSERTLTWAQLDARASELAARLAPGERLGVLAGNEPEVVALVHAAARARATLALLNTRLAPAELAAQVRRAGCGRVLVGAGLREKLLGLAGVDVEPLHAPSDRSGAPALEGDPPLTLIFTSGTTGEPKAAALGLAQHLASAEAAARHLGAAGPEVHLANLPLFHVGGLAMVFRAARSGGALVLHERFDAERVLRDLRERSVTHLSLVATTLARLLEADARPTAPHLQALLVGGGPLPAPLRARAGAAGLQPLHTYGLTEAASQVTTVRPADRARAGDSAGTALPGTEVRIVDAERRPLPPGQPGEIEVRGPTVMRGYLGNPEATALALPDGWLRTRDLGTLDAQGFLTVHARRSDLILSGGENVYPAEVEAALLAAPGVLDCAVLARADAAWGQVPVCALVLAPGAAPESALAHLEGRLARYKHPRQAFALAELPRTASGKVDRPRLRALLGLDEAQPR